MRHILQMRVNYDTDATAMRKSYAVIQVLLILCLFLSSMQWAAAFPLFQDRTVVITKSVNPFEGCLYIGGTTSIPTFSYDHTVEDLESATFNSYVYCFQASTQDKYVIYNFSSGRYLKIDNKGLTYAQNPGTENIEIYIKLRKVEDGVCYFSIQSTLDSTNYLAIDGNKFVLVKKDSPLSKQFAFVQSDGEVVPDSSMPVTIPDYTPSLGNLAPYLKSFKIEGKTPPYTRFENFFLHSVASDKIGKESTITFDFEVKDPDYKLYLNDKLVVNGASFKITIPEGSVSHSLVIRKGLDKIDSANIQFTPLPVVQLYSKRKIGTTYSLSRTIVHDPTRSIEPENMVSTIRVRGATSTRFPKKSYALKLKDERGENPIYRPLIGLREDNNWILDAMYVDRSRMRNRVSTDLWNDFSAKPYYAEHEPKMINGTRGRFIEVFLNEEYIGLYCFTEKIDRKQLNLKKFKPATDTSELVQRGALYKSVQWSYGTMMGGSSYPPSAMYDNKSETWDNFEVKYPDFGDGEPINWKPLYDAVMFTGKTIALSQFTDKVATYFDIPVFRDYALMIELMLATDNHGKNLYYSIYDQTVSNKISITPWDMDGVWGIRWDGSTSWNTGNTNPRQDFDTYLKNNEHDVNNLLRRLKASNVNNYNVDMAARYKELRKTHFSEDSLINRFKRYHQQFFKSGALKREADCWFLPASFIVNEVEYIETWIRERLAFLDKKYNAVDTSGVEEGTEQAFRIVRNPVNETLMICGAVVGETIQIYDLHGRVVLSIKADQHNLNIPVSHLKSGVYLLKSASCQTKIIIAAR